MTLELWFFSKDYIVEFRDKLYHEKIRTEKLSVHYEEISWRQLVNNFAVSSFERREEAQS